VQPHRILLAASLSLLLGCSDSTGTSGLSGTLEFSYSGFASGSFSATGAIPLSSQTSAEWAVGGRDDTNGFIVAEALVPRSGGTYDIVTVIIYRTATGSSGIDVNCNVDCADVLFEVSVNASGTAQQTCALEAGTVALTSVSDSRAQGTFSGTGTCFTPAGGQSGISITGGTFNVALVAGLAP